MAWLPLPGPLSDYRQHQQEFNKGMFSKLLGMQIQKHLKEQDMENEMQRHAEDLQLKRMQAAKSGATSGAAAQKQAFLQSLMSQFMTGQQPQTDDIVGSESGSIRPDSHSPSTGSIMPTGASFAQDSQMQEQPDEMAAPDNMLAAPGAAFHSLMQMPGALVGKALHSLSQMPGGQQGAAPIPQAMPSTMQPTQAPQAAQSDPTGPMYDRYKKLNPMQQQMLKHAFKSQLGFVPFEHLEKQEEEKRKAEADFDLFKKKEEFKTEQKRELSGALTVRARSLVQGYLTATDRSLRRLDDYVKFLKDNKGHIPSQYAFHGQQLLFPWGSSRDIQARLNQHQVDLSEPLTISQGIRQTDAGALQVAQQTKLKPGENVENFIERLEDTRKTLKEYKASYREALKSGNIANLPDNIFLGEDDDDGPVTHDLDEKTGRLTKRGGGK